MRKFILNGIAVAIGTLGWITLAGAELSATRSVIAILGGELYIDTAVGHLNGSGTLNVHSQADSALTCSGDFTSSKELGGAGQLQCSDGAAAAFKFTRLDVFHGHGAGSYCGRAQQLAVTRLSHQRQPPADQLGTRAARIHVHPPGVRVRIGPAPHPHALGRPPGRRIG